MDQIICPEDVVADQANLENRGTVERTHGDIDTHYPIPEFPARQQITCDSSISRSSFRAFMDDGIPPKDTVLVRWRERALLELVPVSRLKLINRALLIGDIVKKNINDSMSGCVLNTSTQCTLQPICDVAYQGSHKLKGFLPYGDEDVDNTSLVINPKDKPDPLIEVPTSELKYADTYMEADLVIYKDWIGRVEGFAYRISIRLADNCVVEIGTEEAIHANGVVGRVFSVGDLVKARKAITRTGKWIFGRYNPNTPSVGTVVSIRYISAGITWLEKRIGSTDEYEPSMELERDEFESSYFHIYNRTRRPAGSKQCSETLSFSELDITLDARVRFVDLTKACFKYNSAASPNSIPRLERKDNLGYDLNVFDVLSFQTKVMIQWQDLTITSEDSKDVVPDASIDDEHAAWPGEIAHTLGLRPPPDMEHVQQPDKVGVIQKVNAEERMTTINWSSKSSIQYARDPEAEEAPQHVISHYIDTSYDEQESISLYDIEAPGQLNVRRGDIVMIANSQYNGLSSRPTDITWIGEIVDTLLNGSLVVRLGAAAEVRDIVLPRHEIIVAVRSDDTDNSNEWGDGETDAEYDDEMDFVDGLEATDDEWIGDDENEIEGEVRYEDENGNSMDEEEVENEDWESADGGSEQDIEMQDVPEHQTAPSTLQAEAGQTDACGSKETTIATKAQSDLPPAYLILEDEVPPDHRYRNEPASTASTHVKRTQKEHKILRNPSALPKGVYIRGWDSRLDLLRVLLIGPTETPYSNAPFVVDFYLPPGFPAEPPRTFFHSWPAHAAIGGIGRVNPNLYEDGTICLSVLGTWDGDKGESWSAAKSTLLQVVVSLLGLVLVREPYYNEAGYEVLIGTEESKKPSALYSERIFLRAKGFILSALSGHAIPGIRHLEDVIERIYRSDDGPRLLEASIKEVEDVLSRSSGSRDLDGLTVLSKGACIPGRRLLERLKELIRS